MYCSGAEDWPSSTSLYKATKAQAHEKPITELLLPHVAPSGGPNCVAPRCDHSRHSGVPPCIEARPFVVALNAMQIRHG